MTIGDCTCYKPWHSVMPPPPCPVHGQPHYSYNHHCHCHQCCHCHCHCCHRPYVTWTSTLSGGNITTYRPGDDGTVTINNTSTSSNSGTFDFFSPQTEEDGGDEEDGGCLTCGG